MPNFDGTGPASKGPKTGAQMGNCEDAKPTPRPFDGRGEGQGQGRNRRAGFFARFRSTDKDQQR